MKKIFLFLLVITSLTMCKENSRNLSKSQPTFKSLDSINNKSKVEIEKYLKNKGYTFSNTQTRADQWKSSNSEEIIQFNGKGVIVFLTFNKDYYYQLLTDLKKTEYKNSGTSTKNKVEIESYSKEKETIYSSSMINPENNKKVYTITFIN